MIKVLHHDIKIDQQKRTIHYQDKIAQFAPREEGSKRFKLATHLLLTDASSIEMMIWHLYGDDVDGGPENADAAIKVAMNHVAKTHFTPLGIEIRSWRIAGVNFYAAVPRYEIAVQGRFSVGRKGSHITRGGAPINSRGLST